MNTAELLRSRGIRPSEQRVRIFEALSSVKTHPSAEALFLALSPSMPSLSRTTVFSTLDLLARAGLAQRLALTGSELRYDADTSRHVHFRCRSCGAVCDLEGVRPPPVPRLPEGFVLEGTQYYAEGLCPECAPR
jgi:Fe2+ or Zn2+ uptake regulation protein